MLFASLPGSSIGEQETHQRKRGRQVCGGALEFTNPLGGTAEYLRLLPTPFVTLKEINLRERTITLLSDGEKGAKVWHVEANAEIKVGGWGGRLEQFRPGQRAWAWLKLDRKKNPV